jgi:catechol 2,3-dioxygenase-like lactoylglutathione lyase family enzyme
MTNARVDRLRYVGVAVPNYDEAVEYYGGVWGLTRIEGEPDVAYFAAEGSPEQFVYRIRKADEKRLDLMAFGAQDAATVDAIADGLQKKGVKFASEPGALQTPGGGYGFRFFDPDGRTVEVSSDVAERPARELDPRESIPRNLSHVVVHSPNKVAIDQFYRELLGFKFSDWIPFMNFLRCNADHHSLAIADGEKATLNHVAFEMRGIDEMMRGGGRIMADGRGKLMMGPGRHYAGDNTYYYFFDPMGNVSEYTAEVEQILDDAAWTPKENLPADQWGTAKFGDMPPRNGPPPSDPGLWVAPPV